MLRIVVTHKWNVLTDAKQQQTSKCPKYLLEMLPHNTEHQQACVKT